MKLPRIASTPSSLFLQLGFLLLGPLFLLGLAAADTAPPRAGDSGTEHETHILVEALDSQGRPPADLTAEDFEIFSGGRRRTVTEVSANGAGKPWRTVIYLDRSLTSNGALQRAGVAIGGLAGDLTNLGTVEVVRADPRPSLVLPPTRDPDLVDTSLSHAALQGEVIDELRALRQDYLRKARQLTRAPAGSAGEAEVRSLVEAAQRQETQLLERQLDYLLSWLGSHSRPPADGQPERRLLLWVSDGYDLDSWPFYLEELPETPAAAALRQSTNPEPLDGYTRELGKGLAALGWTTVGVSLEVPSQERTPGSSEYDDFQQASGQNPVQSQPTWSTTSLEKLRRRLKGETPDLEARPLLKQPLAPLEEFSRATAGAVATRTGQLREVVTAMANRIFLRYEEPLSEEASEVAVRIKRPSYSARGPRWTSAALPEEVAAARVRRLLAGDSLEGELEINAALRQAQGGTDTSSANLEAWADLIPLSLPEGSGDAGEQAAIRDEATVRITVALGDSTGPSSLLHELRTITGLSRADAWRYQKTLAASSDFERVAVLIEDLESGSWGGHLAAFVSAASSAEEEEEVAEEEGYNPFSALAEAAYLPKSKAIQILPPADRLLKGKVRFRTLLNRQDIARVAFFLDDEEVAVRERPPFAAQIGLGRFPQPHTLRAVAYASDGRELGRDTIVLNDSGSGFRVLITSPEPGNGIGSVDVEADVRIPTNRRLDRLEISWNDRRVATLYGPPYRQRVVIPSAEPTGFIRVVGILEDGRTAEDVVFMNQPDFGERVQIRLVELFTVVTDRDGRPVRGLSPEDFMVREEGKIQEIESFDDAGDFPLSLGLTIDSSASMFVKLPTVQRAARDFVRGFLSGKDQAMLVDFDTEPRLSRELTGDLRQVIDGIDRLQAGGDTHLWESIVFTLMELQGISGKKAVVVFSDGAQEEEGLPFKACLEFTRRMGIPVYLIVLHPGLARGDDLTPSMKTFTRKLERLTASVGGRTYYIPNTKRLSELYSEIDAELRSQYLLTYYPKTPPGDETWRGVSVEVQERSLKARTIAGYFVR